MLPNDPAGLYDASERPVGLRLPEEYLMIKSLEIRNFRCFKKVALDGLRRVNVLVGPNGTGKTTFLEALFVTCGASPELALRLRNFRGMGTALEVQGVLGLEEIWKNLFHDFDQRKTVSIDLQASDLLSRSLTISMGSAQEVRLPLKGAGLTASTMTTSIEFAWTDGNGAVFKSRPAVSEDKITFQSGRSPNNIVFIPSSFRLSPEESAKRLSNLSRRNAAKDLVTVLQTVYSQIQDVSVENSDGNWEVFVSVENLPERIPLALFSSGASRLVAMILAITSAKDGTVLIDEIENGFYYKTFPEIWKVLYALADEYKCQLFISTHSQECINAIAAGIGDSDLAKSFTLLSTEREQDGSRISISSGDVMAAAIVSRFELR